MIGVGESDCLTGMVIDECIRIHRGLGPGLLESVYEKVLAEALLRRGLVVQTQVAIAGEFDGLRFERAGVVDILVESSLVLEVKAVDQLQNVHMRQILTYLRLLKQPVGLLLNFSGETMKEGIRRVANNHAP